MNCSTTIIRLQGLNKNKHFVFIQLFSVYQNTKADNSESTYPNKSLHFKNTFCLCSFLVILSKKTPDSANFHYLVVILGYWQKYTEPKKQKRKTDLGMGYIIHIKCGCTLWLLRKKRNYFVWWSVSMSLLFGKKSQAFAFIFYFFSFIFAFPRPKWCPAYTIVSSVLLPKLCGGIT